VAKVLSLGDNESPEDGGGMKEENWHRRHAVMLASELPEETEDALAVWRLATELVTGPSPMKRPAPVVVRNRGDTGF